MNFLVIGDVVGLSGVNKVKEELPKIVKENNIDVIIVNGENSAAGKGIRIKEYDILDKLGVDVITMGNHIYYRKEMAAEYIKLPKLIIPANITNLVKNEYVIFDKKGVKIGVTNILGTINMFNDTSNLTDSFSKAKEIVNKLKEENCKYIFVDFHAETTAEKIAMGHYLKDDVTCIFGTHTHVQTADERIIDGKMAYITDVGMTGPKESVLGLKKEVALKRFVEGSYAKYECSDNEAFLNGIIVTTDDNNYLPINIQRLNII